MFLIKTTVQFALAIIHYIISHDYSKWITDDGLHSCVLSFPNLSAEEMVAFCDKARKRYYLRPSYIASKMKQFIFCPEERKRLVKAGTRFVKFLFRKDE